MIVYTKRGDDTMDNISLKIQKKKFIGESAVISLRLPKDMICHIDTIAKETGRTRNELLITCLEFAIDHMEIVSDNS